MLGIVGILHYILGQPCQHRQSPGQIHRLRYPRQRHVGPPHGQNARRKKARAAWLANAQERETGCDPVLPPFSAMTVVQIPLGAYHEKMPTVLRAGPYRFFFYAGDAHEPPHVHVERDDSEAKFWLDPVRLQWSHGFAGSEINKIEKLVLENRQSLLDAWNEFIIG